MSASVKPWFANREGEVVVYRVNRRPLGAETLFPAQQPDDVFDHFTRMLAPGWEVVSGRGNQRIWRIGGVERDPASQLLTGKLGWVPRGEEVVPEWSAEDKDWLANFAAPHGGRILPFGFDGESRLLAVVRDGTSAPNTIGAVFQKVLRENERELADPTTEWSVEPILDARDFLSWLDALDVVVSVSFTAKLPNPEPRADFADLVQRMERHHATTFTETYKSRRAEGLTGVEDDPDFKQAVAMGTQGFATLRGRGRVDGTITHYGQEEAVASERIEELPSTWEEMRAVLGDLLKNRLRRFLNDGNAA